MPLTASLGSTTGFYVFADKDTNLKSEDGIKVIEVVPLDIAISPIIFSVPLQM